MDKTYIKIKGQWKYLYRSVDSSGQAIDFFLTANRDKSAAMHFFRKAFRHQGKPKVIPIYKIGANTAAVDGTQQREKSRRSHQNQYLNNLVEQVNRNIKC